MAASEKLEGTNIVGTRNGTTWKVGPLNKTSATLTPGQFSYSYIVEDPNGKKAFLKASDIGLFTSRGADALDAIQLAINAHNFERKILDHCHGNNMDKIVTALDYGHVEVIHNAVRDTVFFLIFELADGDLRKHVNKINATNLLWCVTALHNFFIAASQLHSSFIAHNDIKPANTLVFDENIHKISDLGRATCSFIQADHYMLRCAGDPRYAPPEQIYPHDNAFENNDLQRMRIAGDLYNLGSITHYLLTARSVTPEVIALLRPEHRPRNQSGGSQDSFRAALPYWRDGFARLNDNLKETCADEFGVGTTDEVSKLIQMVAYLCEPDPLRRGHPKNQSPTQNQYGLERFISSLDYMRARLAIKAA